MALDQAKTTGWALFENGSLASFGAIELGKHGELYESILAHAKEKVRGLVVSLGGHIDCVVLEDIQMQKQNVTTYKKLAMLLGVLMCLFQEVGISCITVPPTRWRSSNGIGGRKRAEQKENTALFVKEKFGLTDVSEDMADAIALGWYGVNGAELAGTEGGDGNADD